MEQGVDMVWVYFVLRNLRLHCWAVGCGLTVCGLSDRSRRLLLGPFQLSELQFNQSQFSFERASLGFRDTRIIQ